MRDQNMDVSGIPGLNQMPRLSVSSLSVLGANALAPFLPESGIHDIWPVIPLTQSALRNCLHSPGLWNTLLPV